MTIVSSKKATSIAVRIQYRVPFKRKILIGDHWTIPFQGGALRVLEHDGYAEAVEVTFVGQSLELAPQLLEPPDEHVKLEITGRDNRLLLVQRQLDNAAAYLECFHDIALATDEVEARYEGETPEEDAQIPVKSIAMGPPHLPALPLTFDMLTRAIMAAEGAEAPKFESTLVTTARQALGRQEFINAFRYAFLLIEAVYGEGQFKNAALRAVLKANSEFVALVEAELQDSVPPRSTLTTDTTLLLASKPQASAVIDHLVAKRGFYFHGNVKRKNAWRPDEQQAAESLSLLTIGIAQRIATIAADAMFIREFVVAFALVENDPFADRFVADSAAVDAEQPPVDEVELDAEHLLTTPTTERYVHHTHTFDQYRVAFDALLLSRPVETH